MRISITTALLALAAAITTSTASPTPHEGHHGYPGAAYNSSVIHSNVTRPSGGDHQGTSPSEHAHSHGHGGTPLLVLNETQVLQGHAPDPLSYIAWDLYGDRQGFKSGHGDDAFDIVVYEGKSHGWLMIWHILFMTGAFFVALPASIVLRSAKHPFQPIAHGIFVILSLLGWTTAASYKKLVPDLYQGSTHSPLSILLVLATLGISALEYVPKVIIFSRRFFAHVQRIAERGGSVSKNDLAEAWRIGRGDKGQIAIGEYERVGLVGEEHHDEDHEYHDDSPKEVLFEAAGWANEPEHQQQLSPSGSGSSSPRRQHHHQAHAHSHYPHSHHVRSHSRKLSYQSDYSDASTLHNPSPPAGTSPTGGSLEHIREEEGDVDAELQRELEQREADGLNRAAAAPKGGFFAKVGRFLWASATTMHFVWERLVLVLAYAMWVSGSVVYTGICREYYLNGCLAHLIKGSIFFLYGMLTFSRYLGAYADQGWAWNRLPAVSRLGVKRKNPPSAELVESSVIFFYGATNTWMERFGAAPGSPYTAKQIQHISIAVMYFFGGAIGIALELGWLTKTGKAKDVKRRWHEERADEMDAQPYRSSYNPFAALCIGVTGIAMAAHHQTYLFQVQIHMLWGTLLAGYMIARCLTYFFLWLNPPRSTAPSRPPTEALASFLLTSGGLAFISSTEQIGFWAMRSGRDDMMMFANVIVALTFFCFTWMFGCLALKNWAVANVAKRNGINVDDDERRGIHRNSYSSHHREEYELGPYGGKVRIKRHNAHA